MKNLTLKAIELSEKSFKEGRFPAGAILVRNGKIIDEGISGEYPHIHIHAETRLIDSAMNKYNIQLTEFELITSLEPCLMCLGKAYWSGIRKITYVLAKEDVNQQLGYETTIATSIIKENLNDGLKLIQDKTHWEHAFKIYKQWEDKINE